MAYILNSVSSAILIAFLLVLVQSYSVNQEQMEEYIDECLVENDITREEFDEFINSTSSEEDEYDEDDNVERKYKCYIHCLARKTNLVDSNGYVDVDFLESTGQLTDENRYAFVQCKEEYDSLTDLCEYAHKFIFCLQRNMDEDMFSNDSE